MTFLSRVALALESAKVPFAIAGGYAVALHGVVRGTIDVDVVLRRAREDFVAAERALKGLGLSPRLPVDGGRVFDFRREYVSERNLVAWSFVNASNPAELVDVLITHDLLRLKTVAVTLEGRKIPIVSKKDLIAMKRASGRPQDLEDIKALEAL